MNTKYYVGVKPRTRAMSHCDIFTSKIHPTKETHGNRYNFCFGGYATKNKALQVAMYQNYVIDNPAYNERCKAEYK